MASMSDLSVEIDGLLRRALRLAELSGMTRKEAADELFLCVREIRDEIEDDE